MPHAFDVAVQGPAVRHGQPLQVPWPCLTCGSNSELLGMPLQQGAAMGLRQVRMTHDLTFQESCEPLGMGTLPFQISLSRSAKKGARSGWLGWPSHTHSPGDPKYLRVTSWVFASPATFFAMHW